MWIDGWQLERTGGWAEVGIILAIGTQRRQETSTLITLAIQCTMYYIISVVGMAEKGAEDEVLAFLRLVKDPSHAAITEFLRNWQMNIFP